MDTELGMLVITAAAIGFIHTLIGPDHYIPFIMMAKAGKWSFRRTLIITVWCGLGHVAGSIALGFIGIAGGIALGRLEFIESFRGEIAIWFLIAFGLIYMVWGLKKAWSDTTHIHRHIHDDATIHMHDHAHRGSHAHVHEYAGKKKSITPWVLFTLFVLGPCEPLIPLLMYPAAVQSYAGVWIVSLVFSLTTIGTMTGIVSLAYAGLKPVRSVVLERHIHSLAGFTLMLSGLAMKFLGL